MGNLYCTVSVVVKICYLPRVIWASEYHLFPLVFVVLWVLLLRM